MPPLTLRWFCVLSLLSALAIGHLFQSPSALYIGVHLLVLAVVFIIFNMLMPARYALAGHMFVLEHYSWRRRQWIAESRVDLRTCVVEYDGVHGVLRLEDGSNRITASIDSIVSPWKCVMYTLARSGMVEQTRSLLLSNQASSGDGMKFLTCD